MSLVTQTIPALFNGISQQPAPLRLSSQAEEQVNAYSTVVDGLTKRPPFEHIAKLSDGSLANAAHIHTINRDTSERYIVVVTDGDINVYDLAGNELVVNAPKGMAYLNLDGSPANTSFSIVTIADYSFIINKTVTVSPKESASTKPAELSNGSWQSIYDNGLDNDVNEIAYYNSYYTGRVDMGSVQTFQDLPHPDDSSPPLNGHSYKISGYDENSFGAYYVIRKAGVWEETVAPDDAGGLDELTMPHALIRESDGSFSFKPFMWQVRQFGSSITNPLPTFVGQRLKDVFYYKNRLGFVAGESVVFSSAGKYDNFFRSTMTALLDSDVVDVAVSSAKVSQLEYAVPFQNNLMLFSDQTQFTLNVDELLTPTSVSIDTATEYDISSAVRPVGIGSDVYFVTEGGNHSRIREYFVRTDNSTGSAASDITAHVPRYLPKGITQVAGNSNEDVLVAISNTAGEENRLYVYKFFWNDEGKVQSSWSHWELNTADDTQVIAVASLENHIYVLIERTDGVYLERADVQSGYVTDDLDYGVYLDRLVPLSGIYLSGADETLVTLPYPITDTANFQLVRGSGFVGEVQTLIDPSTYNFTSPTEILIPTDETAGEIYAGVPYEMRYTFSQQFMRTKEDAITTGRYMLRTFVAYFTDTAFFSTEVAPYGTDPLIETVVPSQLSDFTGKTVGADSLIIGEPVYHTGSYSFQVYGNSKEAKVTLVNDTHVQSKFQSVELEGFYTNRAKVL